VLGPTAEGTAAVLQEWPPADADAILAFPPRAGPGDSADEGVETSVAEEIEIRRLAPAEVRLQLDALAAVLHDCVAGGASVSYLDPFSHEHAREAFEGFAAEVELGRRLLLAAFVGGDLVGTVQVILALPPNQPHRGEIAKLLVRRSARRRGIAWRLMEGAEAAARAEGKTLLVLDTVTGDPAERLYERMGWNKVGVIPGYALYPDRRPCDTTVFWKSLESL
jgi:GNAT superfamily N-acetyltransferase